MPKLTYLISGSHEDASEYLRRAAVGAALRKAKQFVHDGYINVKICTPRGQVLLPDDFDHLEKQEETAMAKGQQRSNREAKKPKKEKIKPIAAAPSQKAAGWQPSSLPGRKK